MTRSPKAETSRSGSLDVSTKMKIAITATTPMDRTRELKIRLIRETEKRKEGDKRKETCVGERAVSPSSEEQVRE